MRMTGPMAGATALLATTLLPGGGAAAADLAVSIEIPRLDVAEYHKPYVAVWLESSSTSAEFPLAVWYDLHMENEEGEKWLKDLRQWWRHIGRGLEMPVDGISGATRPPGGHDLHFDDRQALKDLPPGEYMLAVEVAREVGGREILRLPLTWPPVAPAEARVAGSHEIGAVRIAAKP